MEIGIWYRFFILIKNDKNKKIKFKARPGADIYNTAKEIINYLNVTGNDKEYTLIFNDTKLTVSQNITAEDVTREYFENINTGTQSLL